MTARASHILASSFWMPKQASTYAGEVDWLFYFIYGISIFFFLLILALVVMFVLRYRQRKGYKQEGATSHSTGLELTWTLIPTGIVILIFFYGFKSFLNMAVAPPNTYEIIVTAFKWGYNFTYPNGVVDDQLHVPLNRPVQLVLTSEDVIHGVFIPAFRIKKDAVPGRYNRLWFQATQPGEYDLFCTQYCGTRHSQMHAKVIVQDASQFARWLEDAANVTARMPPAEAGKYLYSRRGCTQCHTADGNSGIGPTFKNIYGHQVALSDGRVITADDNYIRESILDPGAKIVAGFQNVMPTYKGRLKDNEILAMIEYLKTLSEKK